MNQFPRGSWISQWCKFLYENSRKYSQFCVSTPATSCLPVSTTLGDKLSPVSLLPAINYCRCRWHQWLSFVPDFHRYHDTDDKFGNNNGDGTDATISAYLHLKVNIEVKNHYNIPAASQLNMKKKLSAFLFGYSGARKKLFYEKILKSKISGKTPFKFTCTSGTVIVRLFKERQWRKDI